MATHGNRSATTSTVSNATLATRLLVSVAWIIRLVVICGASPRFHAAYCMPGRRGRGATDTCAGFLKRLAGSYRNAALGEIVAREGKDEVVFQFGGWKSRMASRVNPDGTTSFLSIDPGVRGFEFNAPAASGVYTRLRLRDAQHTYEYESSGGGGRGPASLK